MVGQKQACSLFRKIFLLPFPEDKVEASGSLNRLSKRTRNNEDMGPRSTCTRWVEPLFLAGRLEAVADFSARASRV